MEGSGEDQGRRCKWQGRTSLEATVSLNCLPTPSFCSPSFLNSSSKTSSSI